MERLSICVDVGSRNVINGMPQLLIFTKFQIARRRRVHANVKSNLFTPHIRVVVYFDYIHIEKRGKTNENSPNVINSPPVCSWWWYSLMMTTQQKLFLTTFYQLPLLHTHTLSLSITTICRNHAYLLTVSRLAAQKRNAARDFSDFRFAGPIILVSFIIKPPPPPLPWHWDTHTPHFITFFIIFWITCRQFVI